MIEYTEIEEYQKTVNPYEINDLLKFLVKNRVAFNGWQRFGGEKKVEYKLFIEEINPNEPEIRVVLTHESPEKDLSKLSKNHKLYIHTNSQKYVSEVEIVHISGTKDQFFILPPTQMLVKKHRRVPRILLNGLDIKEREVYVTKNNKVYSFNLLDISKTGIGLSIPRHKAKYFNYENDNVFITKLFGHKLLETIQGKIVYLKGEDDRKNFRVGVQFFDEIEITKYDLPQKQMQQTL